MAKTTVTDTQNKNYTVKKIEINPDNATQVFTYKFIRDYCAIFFKKLPKDAKYVVRGLNILRDTTLKSYNDPFMTEDEYAEYTAGKVKDNTKFKYFYGFTISIRIPNEEGNLFL